MAVRSIAVIGATGKTGMHVVDMLREKHDVRVIAVGRNLEKLSTMHSGKEGVELRVADVTKPETIHAALEGADAVMTCTGFTFGSPPPYTDTAQSVIDGMVSHGIRKLVFMGTVMVTQKDEKLSWSDTFLVGMLRYILCMGGVVDGQVDAFEKIIKPRSADIDWVYVRPDTLEDGPPEHPIVAADSFTSVKRGPITRSNVARFMVDHVFDEELVHTAKYITENRA